MFDRYASADVLYAVRVVIEPVRAYVIANYINVLFYPLTLLVITFLYTYTVNFPLVPNFALINSKSNYVVDKNMNTICQLQYFITNFNINITYFQYFLP